MTTEQNRDATRYMDAAYTKVQCTLCHEWKYMDLGYHISPDGRCWEPFYGDLALGKDVDGPVCPDCVEEHLEYDDVNKDYVLKPTGAVVQADTPVVVWKHCADPESCPVCYQSEWVDNDSIQFPF